MSRLVKKKDLSLFKKIFKSEIDHTNKVVINWIPLIEFNQLDELLKLSEEKPVLIFKHSTRCGISSFALKKFQSNFDIAPNKLSLYFLDLLKYRQISTTIADHFKVRHQSPQVLLIYKGEAIYNDSHGSISIDEIKKVI